MRVPVTINQIFGGLASTEYLGEDGSFVAATAIDPDYPAVSSRVKSSGLLVPIGYADFSSTNVNDEAIALITNPKNTLTYAVLSNGKLISYSSALTAASETLIGTVTGSKAHGAAYYNNYIYIFGTGASENDVSRYGPLDNAPSLANGVWTGATLGSQTALVDTTYPSLRSVEMPNHWAFAHGDNALYFLDFKNGQGLVHKIITSKTTDEGDTNNGSAYNSLDLPFGFYPTSLTNVSTNLFITGIYTTDTTVQQGKAAFVVWDPTDTTSFHTGPIALPDTLVTASLTKNGEVYFWGGNSQNGVTLYRYLGGESYEPLAELEEGLPPFAGAVDTHRNRVVWGGFTTNPTSYSCVWAYGSKNAKLPKGIQNIAKTAAAGATPTVSALKYVLQSSYIQPQLVIAWNDASDSGIDKYSATATLAANMRFMVNIGQKFEIKKIRIPLAGAVNSTTTITPLIYLDDFSSNPTDALPVINNTNYPSKRKVLYRGTQLRGYVGENNFVLDLTWTNTNPLAVALPIRIDVEVKNDEA